MNNLNLDFNKKLCLLGGFKYHLPESFYTWSRSARIVYHSVSFISNMVILQQAIFIFIKACVNLTETSLLINCICSVTYLGQIFFKWWVLVWYSDQLKDVIRRTVATSKALSEHNFEDFVTHYNIYYNMIKFGSKIKLVVDFGSINVLLIYYAGLALVFKDEDTRSQPSPSWMPFSCHGVPNFYICVMNQYFGFGAAALQSTAIDVLVITILAMISCHIAYLQQLFVKVIKNYEDLMEADPHADQGNIEREFGRCLQLHQDIMITVEMLRQIVSPIFNVSAVVVMIDIFCGGILTLSDSHWELIQRLTIMSILMSNFFQFFLTSLLGDSIADQGEQLIDPLMSADLVRKSSKITTKFLFLQARAHKTIIFKIFNFCPVSSETFNSLLQMTYSFFVTALKMLSSEEE